jgi:cholesterol oxidase
MADAEFDAVIVGSGFGGSVAALRLSEAGRRVCVVERGRSYEDHVFPREPLDAPRLLWRHPERRDWTGLYDIRVLSGVLTVAAAGLGGGSLVFANVLIRPDARAFDGRWPDGIDLARLTPFYERVESEIRPSPVPAGVDLVKDRAMDRVVERLGRSDDLMPVPLDIDWDACQLVAECEFGCPFAAKRTLDMTYLARARRHGVELRTESRAIGIEPTATGFRVHLASVPGRERSVVRARRVVLSAGTLGTVELLLRSRDQHRTLPSLSRRLGERFSANGDFIGLIVDTADPLDPWRGPDVTAVLRAFDSEPGMTVALPTFAAPMMAALAGSGRLDPAILRPIGSWMWPWLDDLAPALLGSPLGQWLLRGFIGRPSDPHAMVAAGHTTGIFSIGRDSASGRLLLRKRPLANLTRLDLDWDYADSNGALLSRQLELLNEIAHGYGGRFVPSPMWSLGGRTGTVHPLGGAVMGDTEEHGVVSPDGEVHGYPGLYVTDGSVIPTSIGFHPALTIAANAERIAEAIVGSIAT